MNLVTRSNVLRVLLALYVAASFIYWVAGVRDGYELYAHPERHARPAVQVDTKKGTTAILLKEAIQAGLEKTDVLEAVNGVPYHGSIMLYETEVAAHPGDVLRLTVKKADGTEHTVPVKLVATESPGILVLFALLAGICLLIGYWVVFAKPAEPNAWLLLILLTFPEVAFIGPGLSVGWAFVLRVVWYFGMQCICPLALLPFGLYFPERSRIDRKLPWLKWAIIVPGLICCIILFFNLHQEFYVGPESARMAAGMAWVTRIVNTANLCCVLIYAVAAIDGLRAASTEDSRRRMRVLVVGTGIGLASLLLTFVVVPALGVNLATKDRAWMVFLGAGIFMLAPLTLAYVVLVQRAMDVRILVRMGTRYVLAKMTLRILTGALIAFILWRLFHPIAGSRIPNYWMPAIAIAVVLLFRFKMRRPLEQWLDRKFFREAYDSERVLRELSEQVLRFTETGTMLETVSRRVAETLHVPQISMLLRGGESYRLAQGVGLDGTLLDGGGQVLLPARSSTVQNLVKTNAPALLYRDKPEEWYSAASDKERAALDAMQAEVLLPLPGRNRLMGVMALGPKRSEAAYTKSDLHLLQMVASQTGLALEVSELAHSLADEATLRERRQREMEIAREVQERMFPQSFPKIEDASMAGSCRSALGVGGDYYDVFALNDGRLGLALGDVSGKGISAALLMASLRASLRGAALDVPENLSQLMGRVNSLVYEASANHMYATFFFAAYDARTRELTFVNAGHNPPMVLRGQQTLRLEAGGPVIGLLPVVQYEEGRIALEPGDLLMAYSDGVSEAMTVDDEEWGEDRMRAAALTAESGEAAAVMEAVFSAADTFTAGAPQHDDMTVLVLKLGS